LFSVSTILKPLRGMDIGCLFSIVVLLRGRDLWHILPMDI